MSGEVKGKTVGERILLHLSPYSRYQRDYVCPRAMTQAGIADGLGIRRGHVAVELKRLIDREHVASRRAHVPDMCSRLKTYHLTHLGELLVKQFRDMAVASGGTGPKVDGNPQDAGGRDGDPSESSTA
jgi:hypothetical protein